MQYSNAIRKDPRAGKPLSAERRQELQEQRKTALGDLSPTAFGALRDRKILEWVWKWGYSTKPIIQKLIQTTRHGICDRLVKRGLLRETKTESGLPVRSFFTLTENGLAEVERHAMKLHKYDFLEPYRVRQNMLRHDLLAQSFTLDNLLKNNIQGFETIFTARDQSQQGVKQPDVMWLMKNDEKYGIEIELTKKWDRDFDDFRIKVIGALQNKQYDRFFLVTDSRAIKAAYEDGFKIGTKIDRWKKDQYGKWTIHGQPLQVDAWMGSGPAGKFACYFMETR
jgi:hypothetical protein